MGATVSNTDVTNETLNSMSLLKRNIINNKCIAVQTGTNELIVTATGKGSVAIVDGDITQENILKNVCLFKSILESSTDTQQEAHMASEMIKKQSAGLFGLSVQNTTAYNKIESVIDIREIVETISNCAQQAEASNRIPITAAAGGHASLLGTVRQTNNFYNRCVTDALSGLATNVGIDISSDLKTDEDSSTSILPDTSKLIAVAIVIAVILFVLMM